MKRVYISGPMTGIPEYNISAFNRASHALMDAGFYSVLPVPFVEGKTYPEYLKDDLKILLGCDGIYMLPGWQESNGAKIEHMVALACGIDEVTI